MKKNYQIQKWTPPKRKMKFDRVFYFTVSLVDDGPPVVRQVGDRPAEIDPDQDSILTLVDPAMEGGIAMNITWLNGKPAPESDQRNRGLLAVLNHIHSRLPEDLRLIVAKMSYGLGHAWGGQAQIHEQEGE